MPEPPRRAATATGALWALSLATGAAAFSTTTVGAFASSIATLAPHIPLATATAVAFASVAWAAGTATPGGAAAGAALGLTIFLGTGWPGWWLLVVAYVIAVVATRAGRAHKTRFGIGEARAGRRGAGNAWANLGVSAIAAAAICGGAPKGLATLGAVAALVTAVSDTVATEIGKAYGRRTWLLTTWRLVPPGTTGAVSLAGTLACVASAIGLAWVASALGLIGGGEAVRVAVTATAASVLEGMAGIALERRGLLDNHGVNFLNALAGTSAIVAWTLLAA